MSPYAPRNRPLSSTASSAPILRRVRFCSDIETAAVVKSIICNSRATRTLWIAREEEDQTSNQLDSSTRYPTRGRSFRSPVIAQRDGRALHSDYCVSWILLIARLEQREGGVASCSVLPPGWMGGAGDEEGVALSTGSETNIRMSD